MGMGKIWSVSSWFAQNAKCAGHTKCAEEYLLIFECVPTKTNQWIVLLEIYTSGYQVVG